jgi:hypothetical protein
MSTYAFKEHLSELTPGATRLTTEWHSDGGKPEVPPELRKAIPAYHDGSRDYRIWVTMIVSVRRTTSSGWGYGFEMNCGCRKMNSSRARLGESAGVWNAACTNGNQFWNIPRI